MRSRRRPTRTSSRPTVRSPARRPTTTLTGTDLGGLTLTPGVYSFATSASLAAATTLTLNAEGNPNARFDFQIGTTLITGSGAAISLINGAEADNVYFQVGSSATLGTGTAFQGNILADQSVTLTTGATMMDGRAFALVGAVTMDTNTVSAPAADLADVTVTKTTAAGPVLAGNDITYTITVLNTGPSDAQTVALTDPLPADTTFVSDTQTLGSAVYPDRSRRRRHGHDQRHDRHAARWATRRPSRWFFWCRPARRA